MSAGVRCCLLSMFVSFFVAGLDGFGMVDPRVLLFEMSGIADLDVGPGGYWRALIRLC